MSSFASKCFVSSCLLLLMATSRAQVTIREFSLSIAVSKSFSDQFPELSFIQLMQRVQQAADQLNHIFRRDAQIGFGPLWIQIYDPRFSEGGDDDFAGCATIADYLARNQLVLDGNYGWSYPTYYEIGHCLFRASGQPSQGTLNSLGIPTQQGRGASNIVRNDESLDYEFQTFFHEIAHQCGAKHTFASFLYPDLSQRHADSAVEIGAWTAPWKWTLAMWPSCLQTSAWTAIEPRAHNPQESQGLTCSHASDASAARAGSSAGRGG